MLIKEQLEALNDLEKHVYNYISEHAEEVLSMRIRDLAKAASVSTTTILRLCHKLQCQGYSEFQYRLGLFVQKTRYNELINADAIWNYFTHMDETDLNIKIEQVSVEIQNRSRIIFLGEGLSGLLADYGSQLFRYIGFSAEYINPEFIDFESGTFSDTMVIILSVFGETKDIIKQLHFFKKEKCPIIAISGQSDSTIVKGSDFSLIYSKSTYKDGITSQIPVIYILEALTNCLFRQRTHRTS